MKAFIAGPMTGLPEHNAPIFREVARRLRNVGLDVLNPAENHDGRMDLPRPAYLRATAEQVLKADAVAVLSGWEHSRGARLEVALARELGLPIVPVSRLLGHVIKAHGGPLDRCCALSDEDLDRPAGPPLAPAPRATFVPSSPRVDVLDEAKRLISGDRNASYGPPTQDFRRTADVLSALGYRRTEYGGDGTRYVSLVPSDVAILVSAVKLSRLMHSRGKRDNWTDLAGYAGCGYECATQEGDQDG